jgi:multisubunit Na+/H+ antiporter MnhE subunit
MTRYAAAVVGLTGLYALALASFAPLDLLFGAILSTALLLTSRRFVFGDRPDEEVSLLHLRPLRRPGIVEVPVGEKTPAGVAVWAVVVGLTPGSYFVDVDRERGSVLIHLIDASDPAAVRRQQEDFYNRYQRKVFP